MVYLWICVFVCFCICVFVYLQWCWYPVEEEQLHRKSTRTGRRRKQPSPAAPEPKLLKLSPKSLLFPTFTGFLHSSALFYIKHNYTRERQWIAADFFQRRAIKSSDTKITDRTSHWKLHLIEHMILQKNHIWKYNLKSKKTPKKLFSHNLEIFSICCVINSKKLNSWAIYQPGIVGFLNCK